MTNHDSSPLMARVKFLLSDRYIPLFFRYWYSILLDGKLKKMIFQDLTAY